MEINIYDIYCDIILKGFKFVNNMNNLGFLKIFFSIRDWNEIGFGLNC